jgi:hypothetical protein
MWLEEVQRRGRLPEGNKMAAMVTGIYKEGKIELLMKDARGEALLDAQGQPRTKPFAGEDGSEL